MLDPKIIREDPERIRKMLKIGLWILILMD